MIPRHPLSARFGDWPAEDYKALVDDIQAHGLYEDILLYEGMILDGWHRYRACTDLMIEPRIIDFVADPGETAESYTWSRNHIRRHTPESIRAFAVAKRSNFLPQGVKTTDSVSDPPAGGSAPVTVEQAAKEAGVGVRTMERAKTVVEKGTEELQVEVQKGNIKVFDAEQIARKPEEEQKKIIKERTAGKPRAPSKPKPKKDKPAPPKDKPAKDDGGIDLAGEMERMRLELKSAQDLVAAVQATDPRAEALKWRKIADQSMRKQSDAMSAEANARKREAALARQLQRCGKAVGEADPEKIAAAVESFVKAHKSCTPTPSSPPSPAPASTAVEAKAASSATS